MPPTTSWMASGPVTALQSAILVAIVAGCGSSKAVPAPTATPAATAKPVYADKSSAVTVSVLSVVPSRTYALLHVTMRNLGPTDYQSPSTVPFRDTSFVEPNSGSSAAACDSDISRGAGLDYSSVPAHSTHTGWIRCDYPGTSHIFVLIWQNHNVGAFRIRSA